MPDPIHLCHAIDCLVQVLPRMLMCARHWHMLPALLQSAVWQAYTLAEEERKDPTPAYLLAQVRAVNHVALKEGKITLAQSYEREKPWRDLVKRKY